jgi:hypothetical protein
MTGRRSRRQAAIGGWGAGAAAISPCCASAGPTCIQGVIKEVKRYHQSFGKHIMMIMKGSCIRFCYRTCTVAFLQQIVCVAKTEQMPKLKLHDNQKKKTLT